MDTIGQYVRGARQVLAKVNKATCGIVHNQMTIQYSFMKGFLKVKLNVLLITYQKLLIFLAISCYHIAHNVYHEFHNYSINIGDDFIDIQTLLNDRIIGRDGMMNLTIDILDIKFNK